MKQPPPTPDPETDGPRLRRLKRRFRWAAVILMVPLVLIVGRAVWGVEGEYRAHHETVARRLFDEMERALTELLRTEERRPVAAYAGAIERPPYVVGYFEFDDGHRVLPGSDPAALAVLERLKRRPGAADTPGDVAWLAPDTSNQVAWMAPGSTISSAPAPNTSKLSLSSLNRAGVQRRNTRNVDDDPLGMGGWARTEQRRAERQGAPQPDIYGAGRRVSLMRAAQVDAEHLVLERYVTEGGRSRMQGLVVSVPRLDAVLVEQTLLGAPVARYAELALSTDAQAPRGVEHGFAHRFAEPFDTVGASLVLATLPDAVDRGWVQALGLGLLLLAPLGLYALYRMSAVTVRFAERQSDFVSAVTHELKTPLTSIRMYGEMLRDGVVPDPNKQQRYYTHITAEAERLSRLIGNVLELARLEKGRRPMNPTVGDAGDALRAVAELFGPQAAAAGFELVVEAPAGLPAVKVDRDALVQVIFNLVDNAVKYARDAEDRRVVLRAEAAGDGVALVVRDHGPGVPARQLRQVFEPFFRGERELTRTAKGTGIGLALVRGLIDGMGGAVVARNAQGGGLEVRITLPALAA